MNTRTSAGRAASQAAAVLAIAFTLTACRTASAEPLPTPSPTPRPTPAVATAPSGAPAVLPDRVVDAQRACLVRLTSVPPIAPTGYSVAELCRMGTIHLYSWKP